METNYAGNIKKYWVEFPAAYKSKLGFLRDWKNIKLAEHNTYIYIKDLDERQIKNENLLGIPKTDLYEVKEHNLYKINHRLPFKQVNLNFLWTPTERFLPIEINNFNFNYFGLNEKIQIELKKAEQELKADGLLISLKDLHKYINSVHSVRLAQLKWIIIGQNAFVLGTPLLPLKGNTYWKSGMHLLPSGYNFNLPILTQTLEKQLNTHKDCYILWHPDASYLLLPKSSFETLSRSSFRKTYNLHEY